MSEAVTTTRKAKVGVAGRFGARYGRKIRENFRKIEEKVRAKQKCPQCGKAALKRVSNGIWECSKCGTKMAGGAYYPETGIGRISRRAVQGASKDELLAALEAEEAKKEGVKAGTEAE